MIYIVANRVDLALVSYFPHQFVSRPTLSTHRHQRHVTSFPHDHRHHLHHNCRNEYEKKKAAVEKMLIQLVLKVDTTVPKTRVAE